MDIRCTSSCNHTWNIMVFFSYLLFGGGFGVEVVGIGDFWALHNLHQVKENVWENYIVSFRLLLRQFSIQVPGKIHLVLEYCKGGDLSFYIQQRHGRIPEAIAKHFLQQLGTSFFLFFCFWGLGWVVGFLHLPCSIRKRYSCEWQRLA